MHTYNHVTLYVMLHMCMHARVHWLLLLLHYYYTMSEDEFKLDHIKNMQEKNINLQNNRYLVHTIEMDVEKQILPLFYTVA